MINTEIEALDLISQLGHETVIEYEAESKTVATIVTELLALQILTPAITVGTIDGAYSGLTRSIKVDGDTILRALFRLRDTVGGYIYVDNDRQLQWASSIGEDKGQQIRYRKNLKGIEREIDYSTLYNRIYAYGAGEGEARIELTAPGYVEDVPSQTEWGGIYPRIFIDRSITHPDTLLAWANLLLADYKNPPIFYRIDTVDLSQSEDLDFSFDKLELGSIVKVIDEDLGIDVETVVVKIEHPDLLHPEQMTLELANRTKDITDTLAEVYDRQQFDQHIATIIGAGQVIVKGTFTVLDWATGGETTIDGSNITTGTLAVDTLTSGTLGSIYITLGAGTVFRTAASPAARIEITQTSIAGYSDATTKQFYLQASDGKAYAGAGAVILDETGIIIKGEVLRLYHGTTLVGILGATSSTEVKLSSVSTNSVAIFGGTNVIIEAGIGEIITTSNVRPHADNAEKSGTPSYRWSDLYATTTHEDTADFYYSGTIVGYVTADTSSSIKLSALSANSVVIYGGTNVTIAVGIGDIIMTGNVRPHADNADNLGGSSYRWKDFYAVTVHQGDTVFANNWRLTESEDNQGIRLLRPNGSLAQEWR